MTGVNLDGIHGTPYIAAPAGSVMGNCETEDHPPGMAWKRRVRAPSRERGQGTARAEIRVFS